MQISPTTSLIDSFGVQFDLAEGSPAIRTITLSVTLRHAHDYASEEALQQLITTQHDPVHYETFESSVPEEYGH